MMMVHRDAATTVTRRRARRGQDSQPRGSPVEVEHVPTLALRIAFRLARGQVSRLRIVGGKTILVDASPALVEQVRRELRQAADAIEVDDSALPKL